jgi:intracellular sulfur oxidation DsrE/DsrF family protein
VAAYGGAFVAATAVQAAGNPTAPSAWQPARHTEDDWFEQTAAKHRFFMDTSSPTAVGQAMAFARNFFEANISGYGLTDADIAQIICVRHKSTPFGFADAMWAKYSAVLSARADNFLDPKSKQPPVVNVYQAGGYGDALRNNGLTIDTLAKRGVRFAICAMSTRRTATDIAQKTGATVDEIFKELSGNLIPNGRLVPAGIVAVSRSQERGYTFSTVV